MNIDSISNSPFLIVALQKVRRLWIHRHSKTAGAHKPDACTGTHTQTFRPVIWEGGPLRHSPDFLTSPSTLLLHSCCGRRCRSTGCQGEGCWLFEQQWPSCERSNCRYTDSLYAAVSTGRSTSSHTRCLERPAKLNNCTWAVVWRWQSHTRETHTLQRN